MCSPRDELLLLVRSCYAAFAARDLNALCTLVAHDCQFEAPGIAEFMPWVGAHRGHQGVRAFVAGLDAHLVFLSFEPTHFVVDNESALVVVMGTAACVSRKTRRSYVNHWAHFFETSDGEIRRFREYPDTAAQLAAVHPWWDTRPLPLPNR